MQESQHKFIKIDEDGFFQMEDLRVQDNSFAQTLFSNLRLTEKKAIVTSFEEKDIFVESFDAPFVVRQIHQQQIPGQWKFLMPHEFEEEFVLVGKKENEELVATNLFLDEWDRFHGFTKSGIPFVFSRAAQSDFFNQLEDFDDTGIVVGDQRYEITNWLASFEEANSESFWTQIYENEKPGWELDQVTPILKDLLPQLKIPRSKVLVLGCGSGNDAAFFAEKGHKPFNKLNKSMATSKTSLLFKVTFFLFLKSSKGNLTLFLNTLATVQLLQKEERSWLKSGRVA